MQSDRPASEGRVHDRDEVIPPPRFSFQALPSGGVQAVELGSPVVLGRPPGGVNQSLSLEPCKRGVDRALFHHQRAIGHGRDPEEDSVSVLLAMRGGLKHQKVQGPGQHGG